jgi:lipopolysaccharide heptosyltransferase II
VATKRVLIVGPQWVGDMVMANALFQVLHRQADTMIDVLAPDWCLDVVKRMPEVNRGIELPFKHGELNLRKRYRLAQQLRKEKYDQSIVLTGSIKLALIPFFARIPQRTGWFGEYRWGLLNDIKHIDFSHYPKMVQRFVVLAYDKHDLWDKDDFPLPKLTVNEQAVDRTLKKFQLKETDQPVLAISPGTAHGSAKRWPEEHFAKVALQKRNEGWQVWLFGSPAEQPIGQKIQDLTGGACINLMGSYLLDELVDLISCSDAVISNDSGILHIAAALRRPLVAIYGSTTPDFTPPLSPNAKILKLDLPCSPCFKSECPLHHKKCLVDITPDLVLNALTGLVALPKMTRAC